MSGELLMGIAVTHQVIGQGDIYGKLCFTSIRMETLAYNVLSSSSCYWSSGFFPEPAITILLPA
jgi:hypothetical protein